jgi:hypothetical protein
MALQAPPHSSLDEDYDSGDELAMHFSKATIERAAAAKFYIEQCYEDLFKTLHQRSERYGCCTHSRTHAFCRLLCDHNSYLHLIPSTFWRNHTRTR